MLRMAGNALKGIKSLGAKGLTRAGYIDESGVRGIELGMALAPDLLFGGVAGALTPGDLGDKALAATGSALGGALGGVALRGAAGFKGQTPLGGLGALGTEMVGSVSGDIGGMYVADHVIRAKGGGMTPWEKEQFLQTQIMEDEMRKKIREEILAQYGIFRPVVN